MTRATRSRGIRALGEHPATGRRFERVDEVYIYRVPDGRITEAWGIEDNRSRVRRLGMSA